MAGKVTAAATDPTPTATPAGEPVAPTAEPVEQNITAQIEELNKRLTDYESLKTQLESKAKEAEAKALRNEAMYKGLQSQTTRTLQIAAEERKRLEQLERNNAEITDIKELLSGIASRVLDENEQKELQYKQREARLKRAEEALATPQAQPVQNAASPAYQNPEDVKAQFLDYYFPGIGVDPNDPSIDWGDGASSSQDAFRRFTVSVMNLKDQKAQTSTQDAMAAIKKETDDALAAFKAQQEQVLQQNKQEVDAAKEAAKEEARKEAEKKLRALGADVSGTPPPDGQGEGSTLMQMMNDQLDDTLLRTPKGREEFERRMQQIRTKVRGR